METIMEDITNRPTLELLIELTRCEGALVTADPESKAKLKQRIRALRKHLSPSLRTSFAMVTGLYAGVNIGGEIHFIKLANLTVGPMLEDVDE